MWFFVTFLAHIFIISHPLICTCNLVFIGIWMVFVVFLMNINSFLLDYRLKKIPTVTKRPIILTLAFIFITFLLHRKRHLFLNDSNLNAHISLAFHREVKITFYWAWRASAYLQVFFLWRQTIIIFHPK